MYSSPIPADVRSSYIKKIKKLGHCHSEIICCTLLALLFLVFPAQSVSIASEITRNAITQFGLGFVISASLMTLLCLAIALSPYGKIRLGGYACKTEFGFFSWTAMLFAAGMGSGLVFWGVAEPVFHHANPPAFAKDSSSPVDMALALTYFHWGIHAWGIYALAGLIMAWFAYNKGRTLSVSSSFVEKNTNSPYRILDFMAVIAVIFGVAGTLANSISLIQTGLKETISADFTGLGARVALLFIIAIIFTTSSVSGLHKGMKNLSRFNLIFVLLLLFIVMMFVSPVSILSRAASSTLLYIRELPQLSFTLDENSAQWNEQWSITYLVWWIAWAPFVGPFIARISKGRTIRQFILCAIFVPTLASIIWFSTFAGSLFELPALDAITDSVQQDFTQGLFRFFQLFPAGNLLSLAAIFLLVTFVITSADSAIFTTSLMTGHADTKNNIIWSLILVSITIALLYQNNIKLNNQIAIIGAIPFTLVLICQAFQLVKSLAQQNPAAMNIPESG